MPRRSQRRPTSKVSTQMRHKHLFCQYQSYVGKRSVLCVPLPQRNGIQQRAKSPHLLWGCAPTGGLPEDAGAGRISLRQHLCNQQLHSIITKLEEGSLTLFSSWRPSSPRRCLPRTAGECGWRSGTRSRPPSPKVISRQSERHKYGTFIVQQCRRSNVGLTLKKI